MPDIWTITQALIYILVAPLVVGLVRYTKARLQGRSGPPFYQFYLDLFKLLRCRAIVPETATWIFPAAPFIIFFIYVLIGFIMPFSYMPIIDLTVVSVPSSDLLLLVNLLVLTRFIGGLAGWDVGVPFGGLGGSREMFLQALTEPAFLLGVFAMTLNSHTASLVGVLDFNHNQIRDFLAGMQNADALTLLSSALLMVSLVLLTLSETRRLPFDNPSTHLELTMIGKAVQVEYSGYMLGLLEWAEALRLTLFLSIVINFAFPFLMGSANLGFGANFVRIVLVYPLKLTLMCVALGSWESLNSRLRLQSVPKLILWTLFFALVAVLVYATKN